MNQKWDERSGIDNCVWLALALGSTGGIIFTIPQPKIKPRLRACPMTMSERQPRQRPGLSVSVHAHIGMTLKEEPPL